MFILGTPAWAIILRTAAVYLVTLIGLRLAGKREIGQMTVFDLVVLLLLANAVQNAMVGPDSSLTGGILAAITLLVVNFAVSQLRLHWPRLRKLVEGSPTILIMDGKPIDAHLRREGIDEDTLEAAIREHGIADISEVEFAVLEIDGSISVVPMEDHLKKPRRRIKLIKRQ